MPRRKQAHTSAPRGKRIRVVLKDGTEFVDKFIERRPHDVVFEGRVVRAADIQSFGIYHRTDVNRPCCGKIDYQSETTAQKAAKSMQRKKGDKYDAYKCDQNAWHIGHSISGLGIVLEFQGEPSDEQLRAALLKAGLNLSDYFGPIKAALAKGARK